MPKEILIEISPREASDKKLYLPLAAKKLKINQNDIGFCRILRKSIDARQRNIKINLLVEIFFKDEPVQKESFEFNYQNVWNKHEVAVIGAGPAGLFAALRLIELGLKPLIFERGKDVSERKKDIDLLENSQILNRDSNYCFGEGGAGTFSDGKLYTRSKKRGDHSKVIEILHYHGADESILYETHPHIGSDKLPEIITNIRNTILTAGGKIFFNSKLSDLLITDNKLTGFVLADGEKININSLILATGHSARDVYYLLQQKNILVEVKQFAIGVRVEHPQELIDEIQYHGKRPEYLPAASYSIVQQVNGRGVYSFCMCPGGQIVPSPTETGEIVVNGMSVSERNSYFANSGLVVQVMPQDYNKYGDDGLAALKMQQDFEKKAYENVMKEQIAPAQRISDFLSGKISTSLPKTSYLPGVISTSMHQWMPDFITDHLKIAFKEIERKMRGFISKEAVMVGVESRTSSPVRIPRNNETGCHVEIRGLFPVGEGAGYSGGIVSSAVDGEQQANKVAEYLKS